MMQTLKGVTWHTCYVALSKMPGPFFYWGNSRVRSSFLRESSQRKLDEGAVVSEGQGMASAPYCPLYSQDISRSNKLWERVYRSI